MLKNMSSRNVMEVISKGSFEAVELEGGSSSIGRPPSSQSTTSQSVRSESQLSLEFLPPEAPHYFTTFEAPSLLPSEEQQAEFEPKSITTAELYDRVYQLSEQIKTELGNLQDVESLDSSRPTPLPEGAGREVEIVSDLEDQSSTPQLNESLDEDTSNKDREEANSSGSDEDPKPGAHYHNNLDTSLVASGGNSDSPGHGHQAGKEGDPNARHFTDPKLQKAFEKMKKLDAKLADLNKKEKEVKRQRQLLEQGLESAVCMALVPTEEGKDLLSPSPVFATQLDENTVTADSERVQKCESSSGGENVDEASEGKEQRKNSHKAKPGPHPHGGTDYIQRNIELASEAGALVAMTDGEKKRLQELLEDDTGFEDPYVAPLRLQIVSGGGFTYSKQEEEKMRDIERECEVLAIILSRLQALIPPEQWESICSSSSCHSTPSMPLTTEYEPSEGSVLLSELSKVDTSKHSIPGEEVLQQFQISREESQRLRDIEEKLTAIQKEKSQELELQPSLPASDLAALLEQCREDVDLLDTADQTSNVTENTTVECST